MFCILIQLFNRYGRRKKDTNNRTYRQKIRSKALLCRRVKYQQNSTQSRSIELAIIFASLARIAIRMIDFSDRSRSELFARGTIASVRCFIRRWKFISDTVVAICSRTFNPNNFHFVLFFGFRSS